MLFCLFIVIKAHTVKECIEVQQEMTLIFKQALKASISFISQTLLQRIPQKELPMEQRIQPKQ